MEHDICLEPEVEPPESIPETFEEPEYPRPNYPGPGGGDVASAVEAFGHFADITAGQARALGSLEDLAQPVGGDSWFDEWSYGPGYGDGKNGWGLELEAVPVFGIDVPGLSGGFSFGKGWQEMIRGVLGQDVSSEGHMLDFNLGAWHDDSDEGEAEPDTRLGGRFGISNFTNAGGWFDFANVAGEAFIGSDGLGVGIEAQLAGIESPEMEPWDPDDNNEVQRTGGWDPKKIFGKWNSFGGGGRIHMDDADNDGATEDGWGIDLGPISYDVKSEAWGNWFMGLPDRILGEPEEPEGLVPTAPSPDDFEGE